MLTLETDTWQFAWIAPRLASRRDGNQISYELNLRQCDLFMFFFNPKNWWKMSILAIVWFNSLPLVIFCSCIIRPDKLLVFLHRPRLQLQILAPDNFFHALLQVCRHHVKWDWINKNQLLATSLVGIKALYQTFSFTPQEKMRALFVFRRSSQQKSKLITYHKNSNQNTLCCKVWLSRDYVHSASNFFLQINKAIEVAVYRPIGQKLLSRVGPVLSGDPGMEDRMFGLIRSPPGSSWLSFKLSWRLHINY